MTSESLPVSDPEDRRKHLDFIQAVVTRMSSASTTTKGWLLPVVTAAYGYAVTSGSRSVAALGVGAVVLFGIIDANYLNQERCFRRLYDAVSRGDDVPRFAMNPSLAAPDAKPRKAPRAPWIGITLKVVGGWFPPRTVWTSWAIAPLYGSLLLVGIYIFWRG